MKKATINKLSQKYSNTQKILDCISANAKLITKAKITDIAKMTNIPRMAVCNAMIELEKMHKIRKIRKTEYEILSKDNYVKPYKTLDIDHENDWFFFREDFPNKT